MPTKIEVTFSEQVLNRINGLKRKRINKDIKKLKKKIKKLKKELEDI